MSSEKIREEFEAWLLEVHGLESEWQQDRNCFADFPAHLAFQAWQASRAALVIELPEYYEYDSPGEVIQVLKDVRKVLEEKGLRTSQ